MDDGMSSCSTDRVPEMVEAGLPVGKSGPDALHTLSILQIVTRCDGPLLPAGRLFDMISLRPIETPPVGETSGAQSGCLWESVPDAKDKYSILTISSFANKITIPTVGRSGSWGVWRSVVVRNKALQARSIGNPRGLDAAKNGGLAVHHGSECSIPPSVSIKRSGCRVSRIRNSPLCRPLTTVACTAWGKTLMRSSSWLSVPTA